MEIILAKEMIIGFLNVNRELELFPGTIKYYPNDDIFKFKQTIIG
jgi:hypothetical protein